jgi:hypothetical protein
MEHKKWDKRFLFHWKRFSNSLYNGCDYQYDVSLPSVCLGRNKSGC